MKILIISPFFPYPPDDGDKIRLYNIIKRLAITHEVSIISFVKSLNENKFKFNLNKYCSRVETVISKERSRINKFYTLIKCIFYGEPAESKLAFDNEMKEVIRRVAMTDKYDIVQIEHPLMAPYIKYLARSYNAKKIIVVHNIGFVQYRREFLKARKLISNIRMFVNMIMAKKWEVKSIKKFDKCITVSLLNKKILNSLNSKLNISVIENGVDIDIYKPLPINANMNKILLIGSMNYVPNQDAVFYFYNKIFPLIRKQLPESKLFIVGKWPSKKIEDLVEDINVVVSGYVDDVIPFYQCCDVTVVPLRAGGGTRLKIPESMALGRPVVSTSIGCEGLNVVDGEHLLVADSPEQFAESIISLLTDRGLYERIRTNARQLVVNHYDWDAITGQLLDVYNESLRQVGTQNKSFQSARS